MKIGVLSDTHSRRIPQQLLDDFQKVDLIVHVGDFCSLDILQTLKNIKGVEAVYGNMDGADIRKVLPAKKIIECGSFKIGLFHGEGAPQHLLDVLKREFKNSGVRAVIFGHSHHPMNEEIDGILYFNPGSPNDPVFAPFCSYGILEINDTIKGKIIKVTKNG